MNTYTINGVGLRYLGLVPTEKTSEVLATVWFTFLYLPILPLRRERLMLVGQREFRFHVIERVTLDWNDVARTYVFGWILLPLLVLWPLPIAVVEVQGFLGIPKHVQPFVIFFAIIWLVVSVWKLKGWDEKRRCASSVTPVANSA